MKMLGAEAEDAAVCVVRQEGGAEAVETGQGRIGRVRPMLEVKVRVVLDDGKGVAPRTLVNLAIAAGGEARAGRGLT